MRCNSLTPLQGRLDEAAAHLAVAETHAKTVPPDRQRRLRVAIAALKLSLARRRGHLVRRACEPVSCGRRHSAAPNSPAASGSRPRPACIMPLTM